MTNKLTAEQKLLIRELLKAQFFCIDIRYSLNPKDYEGTYFHWMNRRNEIEKELGLNEEIG